MIEQTKQKGSTRSTAEVPVVSTWLQNGFHRFLRPMLKRHFHAIAIERESRCEHAIAPDEPLIVYANHPSWWDPLIAHFVNQALFPQRQFFAPIDAEALENYQVFAKLGFYGVRLQSASGAAAFLKTSTAILDAADTSIWLTPEGRFADCRDRSAELMPGLAHLCAKRDLGTVLPLAFEYVFWEERLPVCLVSLGNPKSIAEGRSRSKSDWREVLQKELRDTQDRLAALSIARSSDPFDNLMRGKVGTGSFYDSFRRLGGLRRGRLPKNQHGDQFQ